MLEKLKKYIENCYKNAEKNAKTWRDIENWRAQAFGALVFCIDNHLVEYDNVANYWTIMWNKFNNLNNRG